MKSKARLKHRQSWCTELETRPAECMLENRTDKDNKITASSKTTWKDEESLEAGLSKWSTLVHRLCKAVSLFVGAEKSETEAKFYWGNYNICSIFLNKAWSKLIDYSGTYSILFQSANSNSKCLTGVARLIWNWIRYTFGLGEYYRFCFRDKTSQMVFLIDSRPVVLIYWQKMCIGLSLLVVTF